MTSNEFEITLIQIALFLFVILAMLSIFRLIKILYTKKIESKEDVAVVLFYLVIIIGFAFVYYFVFKKNNDAIDDTFDSENKQPIDK